MTPILQSDPRQAYLAQREEIDAAIAHVLASGRYILGPEVARFEQEFAAYVGARHAVSVANGTDAIELALRAAGVRAGDAVITVANTAVATVAAIERCGARVALADVDDDTMTMSPASVETLLAGGEQFRALVPVHLYGRAAEIGAIARIAARHDLIVVEDCAQAHGAAGTASTGVASAFSFYPTKNLGALGDGGAVTTDEDSVADRIRLLRQYGWRERDNSVLAGFNSRLDEIQAAVLRVKLRTLDAANERRRTLAARYTAALHELVRTPLPQDGHVYHQYVVRVGDRDAFRSALQQDGVGTLVHYPIPIHLQQPYAGRLLLPPAGLPATERAANEIVSLPMHAHLTDDDQARVIASIERWSRRR